MSIEQAFNIKRKADILVARHYFFAIGVKPNAISHAITSVEFALEHTHHEDVYKREELNLLLNELKSRL